MADQVGLELQKTVGDRSFPVEYIEFQFCREFGILPHQLGDMAREDFDLFCAFMRAEGEATRLRELQARHYRK